MDVVIWDWLSFGLRWLHIVTAIAWIGSSFYFIALDLSLRKRDHLPEGVSGEAWQVHGGGFYNMRKYTVAPPELPPELTWFKWESYATWISGFFLLCVVYYAAPELYLIDIAALPLEPWQAVALGVASLVATWIIYDLLCRSPLVERTWWLLLVVFAFLSLLAWGLTQVYSGRGAFIHLGAAIATIMSANVAMNIIPNQKRAVAMLLKGETPPAVYGKQAKQRSLHNNYLTLPVIFLMLSNHYPLAFAVEWNWLIAILVMVMGGVIRHWFNTWHAGGAAPNWCWPAAAALFAAIVALSAAGPGEREEEPLAAADAHLIASVHWDEVESIVLSRCSMCHAAEPLWDGLAYAPKGVALEEPADIVRHAAAIYAQAARSRAMPPGNITETTAEERAILAAWYEGAPVASAER